MLHKPVLSRDIRDEEIENTLVPDKPIQADNPLHIPITSILIPRHTR